MKPEKTIEFRAYYPKSPQMSQSLVLLSKMPPNASLMKSKARSNAYALRVWKFGSIKKRTLSNSIEFLSVFASQQIIKAEILQSMKSKHFLKVVCIEKNNNGIAIIIEKMCNYGGKVEILKQNDIQREQLLRNFLNIAGKYT